MNLDYRMPVVDEPFRLSAWLGRITAAKDTATPSRRLRQQPARGPGSSRPSPSERRDRLMTIVPEGSDTPPPPAASLVDGCPECVLNVEPPLISTRTARGWTAAYECSDCGHTWTTDWSAA